MKREEIDFDDGRTRALAAMGEMERYIPAAMIRKPDNSLKSKLTTGLLSNYFAPRRRVVSGDFIVASQKSFKFIDVAKQILFLKNKPKNFIELIKVKNKVSIRYFSNLKISKILNIKFTKIKDGLDEYLK